MSEAAQKKPGTVFEKDQVVKIINSVISKVGSNEADLSRETIFRELSDLKRIIDEARNEIGQAKAGDISGKHIPTATDELDEIIKATANATGAIMDACEVIEGKASAVGGENGDTIANEVTKIYEACSFQDITGQRIKKVVNSLQAIEQKVASLMTVIGEKLPGGAVEATSEDTRVGDARLLNGPQATDKAMSQNDIDSLLSELFD